ncbi:nitrite reductase small subunit NirD [Allokutzneria sp. A3M-2-11 16]|uniref:nitrite reductase small subunit NirD n=1 Tax=Allokutzneria sp. A3M-2-11 16 TaxID=2962043 RepID=UPI0020B6A0C3|nr:nitrite reductase small subunit NirD [Allokutzneria sp. A3M-2-11 16]MCP3802546.1 nitrite reductase small subunit NirD [Allokutzneria sp. A3M-2-11 16]
MTTSEAPRLTWLRICPEARLWPERGSAALLPDGGQVALFRTTDGAVHAVGNLDPCTGAAVLSRGILGDRAGRPVVISPMLKHTFDLSTGECVDDPLVAIPVYPARVVDGVIEVAVEEMSGR